MAQTTYGTVYTGKQIAKQLRQSDRNIYGQTTWGGMEGDVAAQYASSHGILSQSYHEATASAYDSYLKNQRAIENSTLIGESKQDLLNEQENTLAQAYQSYQQGYAQGEQQLQQNYMQQISDIENALLQQGEMTAKYANYHGNYYDYLIEQYGDKLSDSVQWRNSFWNNDESRFYTWNELKSQMYDEDNNLTVFGVDVLDRLENEQLNIDGITTWGDYLAQTDADIFEWATSYNPYNFTVGGSNAATFKTMTGRTSTDFEYSFLERFGGLNSEQVDKLFEPFNEAINKIETYGDEDKKNYGKDIMKDIKASFDELDSLTKSLGINKDLNAELEEMGIQGGLESISAALDAYAAGTKDMGEMTLEWFGEVIGGASTGLMTGGFIGSFVPVPGARTAGMVIGTIVGAIVGIVDASKNVDKQRTLNKELVNQATAAYKSAINNIVMYAHQKQQIAEEKFIRGII